MNMEKEQEMEKPEKISMIGGGLAAILITTIVFRKLPSNGQFDGVLSAVFVSMLAGVVTYLLVVYLISQITKIKNK